MRNMPNPDPKCNRKRSPAGGAVFAGAEVGEDGGMCYASTMPLIGHRLLCGVVLSAVLALRAETPLECDFRVPPPGGARPLVALSVPFEAFAGEWLSVQMRSEEHTSELQSQG